MKIAVVIPIYRPLYPLELRSLRHNAEELKDYPQYLLTPPNTDVAEEIKVAPLLQHREVTAEWLGEKNGLLGYNRMMTDAAFYDLFGDYDYILICHVDAWVFKGWELTDWANRGYDCVAAPWLVRHPWWYELRRRMFPQNESLHGFLHGKVGNGGLSLRKVACFARLCAERKTELYNLINVQLLPEDVVWAMQYNAMHYPPLEEALQFAFDTKPAYCYMKNHQQIPFGCHAWFRGKHAAFWKNLIEE